MRGLPRYIAIRIATGLLALIVVTLIIQFFGRTPARRSRHGSAWAVRNA
jgi:hypothetical protein